MMKNKKDPDSIFYLKLLNYLKNKNIKFLLGDWPYWLPIKRIYLGKITLYIIGHTPEEYVTFSTGSVFYRRDIRYNATIELSTGEIVIDSGGNRKGLIYRKEEELPSEFLSFVKDIRYFGLSNAEDFIKNI